MNTLKHTSLFPASGICPGACADNTTTTADTLKEASMAKSTIGPGADRMTTLRIIGAEAEESE